MNKSAIDINTVKPLVGGFYTASEASRLLGLTSTTKVHSWLGHTNSKPTLVKQYKETRDVGFWDLMEIRFVNYFRNQGVSLQHLRKVAAKARTQFNVQHPFALSNIKYKTDRKQIFREINSDEKDTQLEEMLTGQLSFYEIVEEFLAEGVVFDPSSHLAKKWLPKPKLNPNVILDPLIAHGQPSIEPIKVPTKALFYNCRAEEFSYTATADWFEIDEEYVREAVDFELRLDA